MIDQQLELITELTNEELLQGMKYPEDAPLNVTAEVLEKEGFVFLTVGKDVATIPFRDLDEVIERLFIASKPVAKILEESDEGASLDDITDEELQEIYEDLMKTGEEIST